VVHAASPAVAQLRLGNMSVICWLEECVNVALNLLMLMSLCSEAGVLPPAEVD
jgi:hypothetical protein